MRKRLLALVAAVAVLDVSLPSAKAPTLRFDHIHLGTKDPVAHVAWYEKHLGGVPFEESNQRRLKYGGTRLQFKTFEHLEPSEGSVIDHVAFSVPDVVARVEAMDAAGVKVVAPPAPIPVIGISAIVKDPFGARVELMDDPAQRGLHHVHLRVPDPARTIDWFVAAFGGARATYRGSLHGVKYGDVLLLADVGKGTPSAGTAIDHLGWGVTDIDATVSHLKRHNTEFVPSSRTAGNLTTPDGIYVELVQRR